MRYFDVSVWNGSSMLRIVEYCHPSNEESFSPRRRFIDHANSCMIRSYDFKDDVCTDEVDNASVLVHAIQAHNASLYTSTDNSQQMILTTHDNMYEGFVEALFVNPRCHFTVME